MRNRKALTPVIASIILIIVVVVVSIAVATWMGALDFSFLNRSYHEVTVEVPPYDNATLAHAWVSNNNFPFYDTLNQTDWIVPLPISLTISTSHATATLKVDYYISVQYGSGLSQTKHVGHEEYSVDVTELWTVEP